MSIVQNKKAFHEYFVEERFEAGIVLQGWEAKSIREGRAQLKEAYVVIRNAEVYPYKACGRDYYPSNYVDGNLLCG